MQDYKHLVAKKRGNNRNKNHKHFKLLTLVLILAFVLVPATVLLVRKGADALVTQLQTTATPDLPSEKVLFPLACALLPQAKEVDGNLAATTDDGIQLRYSINADFQQAMQQYLDRNSPPYAVFIAIEPKTGRILSLNSSSQDPTWDLDAIYRTYPMASLFKMVTAAAALERGMVTPNTKIAFQGRAASENPDIWDPHPKRGGQQMTLTQAMGHSVNPVYGKLASDLLGKQALEAACDNFGFNRTLLDFMPLQPSRAEVPDTVNGLRLMGSGLDHDLQVSPLHAAAITAAIANKGTMMTPRLLDGTMFEGKEVKTTAPRKLTQVVHPEVADDLRKTMLTTVINGTSGQAFRTHNGKKLLSVMQVAAKTGSISGTDPAGSYSWFTAYAPAKEPQIALTALVINNGKWRIRAPQVGEHALTTFFREAMNQTETSAEKTSAGQDKPAMKTNRSQGSRKKNAQASHQEKAG